jgi:multimeric flavodoxin WrbA
MQVLAFVGSPRVGGNTEQLTQEALRIIADAGIKTELIRLADKEIHPCTACMACRHEETCSIDDDLPPLYWKMKEANGILIASPVYLGSGSAQIKAFMDRAGYISYNNGYTFSRKVGGPLVTAGRNGGNFTYAQMVMWFMILGMIVPGSMDWNTALGEPISDDQRGMDTIRTFAKNVAWLVRKLA